MAITARVADCRTRTLAHWTALLNREKTLLHSYLANPVAGRALDGFGSFLRTCSVAGFTSDLRRHVYRHRVSADRFFEIETQFVAEIGAAKHLAASLPAAAENIAEHITENIAESFGAEPTAATRARFESIVAETIVGRTLICVAQDFVSLFGFLELGFGARVVPVTIRVVFHRKTAVRLLDLAG
jgi:hypothetical protein